MTSAIHASVAKANRTCALEINEGKHYRSTIRFSLRRYLPKLYCTPAFAGGFYTTGWMKAIPASASESPAVKSFLCLLVRKPHDVASGMTGMQRLMIMLGKAASRNQLHCEKQWPPSAFDHAFSADVHRNMVEIQAKMSRAALRLPTVQKSM